MEQRRPGSLLLALYFMALSIATSQGLMLHMATNQRTASSSSSSSSFTYRPTTTTVLQPRVSTISSMDATKFPLSDLGSKVKHMTKSFSRRIFRRTNVPVLEDISNFSSILHSYNEQFVAVFFYSPFCKACQAAAPRFQRLSHKFAPHVKFLSVPLNSSNRKHLLELGVKKFPFAHIYDAQRKRLDELPILRKLIPNFEQRLHEHINSGSDDPNANLDVEPNNANEAITTVSSSLPAANIEPMDTQQ